MDFLFGYGSIINEASRQSTALNAGVSAEPAVVASLLDPSLRRTWSFRSHSGFTALGLERLASDEELRHQPVVGVLFPIDKDVFSEFDAREVGYQRVSIECRLIKVHDEYGSDETKRLAEQYTELLRDELTRVWVYLPDEGRAKPPDRDHPVLQSYLDVCLRGCLEWGGESLACEFVESIGGWTEFFLYDTPLSRRPWIHRKDHLILDGILEKFAEHVRLRERRHPEEYSARHMFNMMGIWGVPTRNTWYTGRETQLEELHQKLFASTFLNIVEVVGMGGVGKTTLVSEFCHRHFHSSAFSLVIWLRAESSASIAADFRRFGMEFGILDTVDNTDASMVETVHQALLRSRSNYLLVFDNANESDQTISNFIPRGCQLQDGQTSAGRGYIVLTSRISSGRHSVLHLGCYHTKESLAFLRTSLCSYHVRGKVNSEDLEALAETLGHLPLALAMAAAYILSSEVSPAEYRKRLTYSMALTSHSALEDIHLIVASLNMTLMRIEKTNSLAKHLLCMLSFMDPDSVSKHLLALLLVQFDKLHDMKPFSGIINKYIGTNDLTVLMSACGVIVVISNSLLIRIFCAITFLLMVYPKLYLQHASNISSLGHNSTYENEQVLLTVDKVWDLLKKYSLLFSVGSEGAPHGRIHRLQAAAIRFRLTAIEKVDYLKQGIAALKKGWRFDREDSTTWEHSDEILKHAVAALNYVEDLVACNDTQMLRELGSESIHTIALLIIDGGSYIAVALSRFDSAQRLLERSHRLLLHVQRFGSIGVTSTIAVNMLRLGRLYRYEGDFSRSEECLQQALQFSEIHNENILLGEVLHEMGVLAIRKHDLLSAESHLLKALSLKRKQVNDASSVAATLHQLAIVATSNSTYDFAEDLLNECLELEDKVTVSKAATLQQLGRVALRRGHNTHARRCFLDSLNMYLSIYGSDATHINIAGN